MFHTGSSDDISIQLVEGKDFSALSSVEKNTLENSNFSGEVFQHHVFYNDQGDLVKIVAGTKANSQDPKTFLRLGAHLQQSVPKNKTYKIVGSSHRDLYLGWGLGTYQFNLFKEAKPISVSSLACPEEMVPHLKSELAAIFRARDWINRPANDLHPQNFEEDFLLIAKKYSANSNVIRGDDLLAKNFPMVHAVGKGSNHAPRLLELKWGDAKNKKLAIVGKAVCFDTGGYDLKPSTGMRNMKKDMGGGALALALASWIMERNLPVNLHLLIPCVENKVSDKAFLPGDIYPTRKKKFVEIDNTDAEGRLILCDPLTYASEQNPDYLVNFATLTGACRVALGPDLPGFFTDNDTWAIDLQNLSLQVADPLWRMPLWEPYQSMLKSSAADLVNSASSSHAGAVTAALYLKRFVEDPKKWIHIDTYCWADEAKPGFTAGGDTQSLRAIFYFIEKNFSS